MLGAVMNGMEAPILSVSSPTLKLTLVPTVTSLVPS
jgi:hypothetical protein